MNHFLCRNHSSQFLCLGNRSTSSSALSLSLSNTLSSQLRSRPVGRSVLLAAEAAMWPRPSFPSLSLSLSLPRGGFPPSSTTKCKFPIKRLRELQLLAQISRNLLERNLHFTVLGGKSEREASWMVERTKARKSHSLRSQPHTTPILSEMGWTAVDWGNIQRRGEGGGGGERRRDGQERARKPPVGGGRGRATSGELTSLVPPRPG